jgi:hypothetical protein
VKPIRVLAACGLALVLVASALAEEPRRERGGHDGHAPREHREHGPTPVPAGVSVPAWKDLTPTQREQLAPMAEQWDTMPASRRVRALERLERKARWEAMTPEERDRIREGARNFRDLPPELREKMRISMATMRGLPEDERKQLFALWRGMDPAQRRAWLETGGPGISPPPAAAKD